MATPDQQRWMVLVAFGAVLVYTALALGDILPLRFRTAFNDIASAVAALAAAGLAYRAARAQSDRSLRTSWFLFAGGLLAWSLGDGVWAALELLTGSPAVTPAPADIGYLALLALALAAVLFRPTRRPRTAPRRLLLVDAGMAVSALLAIGWSLVIGPLLEGVSLFEPGRLLALVYPAGDLLIVACLLIAMLRELEDGPGTWPLLGGLALLTVADVVYAALLLQNRYVTGHPVDVIWFAALALFGLAAARERMDLARWRADVVAARAVMSSAAAHAPAGQTTAPPAAVTGATVAGATVSGATVAHAPTRTPARVAAHAAARVPSLRTLTPTGARAIVRGPVWRYLTPAVLLALATLVVVVVSLQRGRPPSGPPEALLGLSWLLLLVRVSLGLQRAAEGHQRERRLRVGHATSFRREQQRRRQLEAIRDVTTELTRELDLTALLTLITRRTASLVEAPIGTVCLWDEATERLVPRAWHGLGSWFADLHVARGEGAVGRAVELGRGVIVNDYPTARERVRPLLQQAPIEAALAAPIVSQGRLLGVIAAADERVGRRFDEDDLQLLELFADQAAVAIEHARLVDEAAAVEALRELSRLKTELLSTVSHELRTPLTLIHGYAELLHVRADGLNPEDVKMMAEEVLLGSRTMIRLVDDLLDFSRLDGSRLRLDLAELARRHVQAWRGQPGGERLQVEAGEPLETYADSTRLDQVIRNLISNALNHAPHGPIIVRAGHDPGWVWLEVQDHGPGIPEEEAPRIWESFFRGERARNSPNRGSGLGLAVVRQLIELHLGKVDVTSAVGVGTTFRVWLPSAPPNGRVGHGELHDEAPGAFPGDPGIASPAATGVLHSHQRSEGE